MTLATIVNYFETNTKINVKAWHNEKGIYVTWLDGIVDELTYDFTMSELDNIIVDICTIENNKLVVWLFH